MGTMSGELYAFPLFSLLLQLYYTERSVLALQLLVCNIETSVFDSELSVCCMETLSVVWHYCGASYRLRRSFGIGIRLADIRRMKENSI